MNANLIQEEQQSRRRQARHDERVAHTEVRPNMTRLYYRLHGFFDEDWWSLARLRRELATCHYAVEAIFPIREQV